MKGTPTASKPCSISARHHRIVRGQDHRAGFQLDRRADGAGVDVGPIGRRHVAQDGLKVQHLRQPRAIHFVFEPGDAGHQAAVAGAAFRRQHAAPVEPHDLFDRFDRERLGAARELGHQHDVQSRLGNAAGDRRQVEHLDDQAAQVDYAEHVRHRAGDGGNFRHRDDFADLEDVDAKQFAALAAFVAAEPEKQQFELVGAGQVAALVDFLLHGFHLGNPRFVNVLATVVQQGEIRLAENHHEVRVAAGGR